ncbi:MAG: AAA family ATPase, partial [Verrucomicrobiota bacterium]
LQDEVETAAGHVSERCVDFLDQEEALSVYQQRIVQSREAIPAAAKVLEVREIEGELNDSGSALDLLLDTVSNLQIEDTTKSTRILDHISALYAELNQTRGAAKARRGELAQKEGAAEFHAQTRLLEQAAANYLDLSVSAEKCEEYLTKVMIQLEELEGRFGDFGEYIDVLGRKRDELYEAFEAKKVQLTEARNRRAESLRRSGERILTGIRHRVAQFETDAEIHGYLAGDLMVQKVRQSIESLRDLGDSVRADDLRTQLQSVGQEALRQLQDRSDLFSEDGQTIAFGEHRFSVNHQELELTLVPRDDQMFFHITGTNFFEPVGDVAFGELRGYWDQTLPSETDEVYRAEYLAHSYWKRQGEMSLESLQGDLVTRYGEGYTKGIHDEDAWQIVQALQETHDSLGVLRFDPATRALAILFWIAWEDAEEKGRWTARWKAKGLRERAFGEGGEPFFADGLIEQVGRVRDLSGLQEADVLGSLIYLAKERAEGEGFRISRAAFDCVGHFRRMLTAKRVEPGFEEGMDALAGHPIAQFRLAQEWLRGAEVAEDGEVSWEGIEEAAAHLLREDLQRTDVVDGEGTRALEGMKGEHRRIQMGGHYAFSYHDVCRRVALHEEVVVPDYERWQDLKAKQLEGRRRELRLDEFHPEVMRAFVRNRLIDEVYLPVIGANLAKQLGTAGAESRADRMGLLLLISPPGYGKTTLMEYVAARLGITFVKVNGPAVGHAVTSLDPGEAPNASAREEVEKLNLALEMGDNVMIYLDDIQHCHPEFLQKFISLCDAQRKMEGVWNGEARTYDLRGKKVAVVMAGNPYTESGGKFQVPDMLANRADTYNLGDILGGHEEAFRVSYLENALTSNAVLSKIAARHHRDIDGFLKMVESGSEEGVELQANYSVDEMEEIRQVLSKLLRVRDTVLRVNQGYIASAAQADAYRVEPPFKLQGSYRNMNRLAAQIEPLMTDAEVEQALVDHYRNESQNLTTGAEANLLKFREMEGLLSPEESERWEGIREQFQKNQVMQGGGDDPVGRIVGQLALFESGLQELRTSIETVGSREGRPVSNGSEEDQWRRLEGLMEKMQRLPVDIHLRLEGGGHGGADSFVPPAVWKVDERIRHFVDDVFLPRSEPQKEISVPDRAQVEREWQQMETSYEVKLPRLFREWFSYKSLARTDFAIARLPAVSSEDPLGEWRELLRQLEEKEWFREQGLVPFAWAGNGVGPLCFDTKESRAGKDYPVRLCEEERLSEEEYRGEPFAEDFAALLRLIEEDLLAFGDSG